MRSLALAAALAACLTVSTADAADLYGEGGGGLYCRFVENAHYLLSLDRRNMREEVARRYVEAADIFRMQSTVYSTSPLFEWSNQTKIACAKAIGYLRRHFIWGPEVDVESVQKCDCFYDRMRSYTGGRRTAQY